MLAMKWTIVIVPEVAEWLHTLRKSDRSTLNLITAALDQLATEGPALGRPLVDTLTGSSLSKRDKNAFRLRPLAQRGRSRGRRQSRPVDELVSGCGRGSRVAIQAASQGTGRARWVR
jgi:hypothetical protein